MEVSGATTALLALCTVSGLVFLRFWRGTRFFVAVEPLRFTLLFALPVGLAFNLLSAALVAIGSALGHSLAAIAAARSPDPITAVRLLPSLEELATASLYSWLLALIVARSLPSTWSKRIAEKVTTRHLAADPIGQLALASLETSLPIAVTLDTRKVIIGHPVDVATFATPSEFIKLRPHSSGFRDVERRLVLTTEYSWLYETDQAFEPAAFDQAIRRSSVVSANLFDSRTYARFAASS